MLVQTLGLNGLIVAELQSQLGKAAFKRSFKFVNVSVYGEDVCR